MKPPVSLPFRKISGFLLLALCCILKGFGQDFSYRHYDIKDGLVGNQVYHSVQDKDGFLWFATETGVSRFDGTRFKNFTTANGLPDNEIVKLFVDSRGRVWMLPFSNSICYYYKGVIHKPSNDSVLAKVRPHGNIVSICEDPRGNILFLSVSELYILEPDGRVLYEKPVSNLFSEFAGVGVDGMGKLRIVAMGAESKDINTTAFYELKLHKHKPLEFLRYHVIPPFTDGSTTGPFIGKRFMAHSIGYSLAVNATLSVYEPATNTTTFIRLPDGVKSYSVIDDSLFYANTNRGVYSFNHRGTPLPEKFLSAENICHTLKDNEGNLWFCSLGNGVWRLNTPVIRNIKTGNGTGEKESVNTIVRYKGEILVGNENNSLAVLNIKTLDISKRIVFPGIGARRHLKGLVKGEDVYYLTESFVYKGTDLAKLSPTFLSYQSITPSLKDIDISNRNIVAVGSSSGISLFSDSVPGAPPKNIRWITGRSTALAFAGDDLYVGTLNGLKRIDRDGKETDLSGIDSLLANRITRLLYDGAYLWIGTNDNGVVCFDGKRVVKNISTRDGLTGNIIRTMYISGYHLWVGTDRGLNKIFIADKDFSVEMRYTTADGLPSNMINTVYVDKNMVYVGTPAGFTFFDEEKMSVNSRCDLRILGITVSGKELQYDSSALLLRHQDNNIRFDFVGISYKSAGDIVYQYKLSGLDNVPKITTENYLQYPTLPSGKYRFELQATNKFGVKSELIVIQFEVAQTLMEKTWFRITLLLAILGLTWWIANFRVKQIRKREREKTATVSKIAELEQQALKAQMNPHFIFNCLNSIQQYVIDKDVEGANRFISGFARLIRQTLDNSGRQFISIREEQDFLRSYLELEKNRFEDRFDYVIRVDGRIQPDELFLPPMLLQPYVENSIRHGLRLKQEGKGLIEINISLWNNQLICSIIDNGVGRKVAEAYKSARHIEYQSKGSSLTSQRIAMMNRAIQENITVTIEDLYDNHRRPLGTKVTVTLPLNYSMKKL